MATAERLFGRRGIDAVSIRDITTAAKANTAAIHYHFGSKDNLVRATLHRRAPALMQRRAELLAALEQQPTVGVRDVVVACVIPTAELGADVRRGGRAYLQFMANLLAHPSHLPMVTEVFAGETDRFMAVLARVTPWLSREQREFRWALVKPLIAQVLGHPDGPVAATYQRRIHHPAELTEGLVDFVTAAFSS